mgnify:CR=1 FL=1
MAQIKDSMRGNTDRNIPKTEQQPTQKNVNEEEPTPAEADAFSRVVLACLKIIYDQSTHQGIVNMLAQGKNDPSQSLADTTTLLITQVDKKSGGKVPETVILPAAADVLGELGNLAAKAGIFQVDERTAAQAMQKTIMSLAEQYGVDPQDVRALLESVGPDQAKQMAAQQGAFNQQSQPAAPAAPMGA